MSKKSATTVHGVSFSQEPRRGQQRVFDECVKSERSRSLNIQLPTGYGKTFTAMGVYSIKRSRDEIDCCVYVVPRDAQKLQACKSGSDLLKCGVTEPHVLCDVSMSATAAM